MTSETLNPTTNDPEGLGEAWTNPTNAFSSNNSYATYTNTGGTTIPRFFLGGFNFTPTGVLLGIKVEVEGKVSTGTKALDVRIFESSFGAPKGSKSITLSTTEQYHVSGDATDLWSWDGGEDALDNLIVSVGKDISSSAVTVSIDHVRVTAYYSLVATLAGNQPAATGVVVSKRFRALTGAQAAPAGALVAKWANKYLAGAQAAAAGALIAKWANKYVAGNQPAASGGLFIGQTQTLEGVQAAAAGVIVGKFEAKGLEGAQASAAGALVQRTLAKFLAGEQAAPSGRLEGDFVTQPLALPVGRAVVAAVHLGVGRAKALRPGR